MGIFIKNKIRLAEPLQAAALVVATALYQTSAVFAAVPAAAPNPQQQGLPSIRREEAAPNKEVVKSDSPDAEPTLTDQLLPSAIRRIVVQPSRFGAEIDLLLSQFIGEDRVSGKALEQVRGQIWDLYRQHGRLVRVALRTIPGDETAGGSTLEAMIDEIRVRTVLVREEGGATLDQSLLDTLLATAQAEVGEGGALDLDHLDSRLKRRMFLKDVSVRAELIPVDPDHVDLGILVRAVPVEPLAWLAQYDNNGMRPYGRDRYTAAISIPGRVLAGDQFDALALGSSGMRYARLGYEFPLAKLGVRLNVWGTRLEYRVPSTVYGNATLLGAGLAFPLQSDDVSLWTGALNILHRHETGNLGNDTPTADKASSSVQAKVDARYTLGQSQSLYFLAALTLGDLDLSRLASAAAQDRSSASTAGTFTRLEWDAGWSARFDALGKLDFGLKAKGQFASKNLDQSEKFALGGPLGVRAYSASEALGDEGIVASADLGYRPFDGLRIFGFYDIGRTRLNRQPWTPQPGLARYTLQGTGAGMTITRKLLVGSATFARQIGANPGLSAAGLDADGGTRRSRLWLTLTWQM